MRSVEQRKSAVSRPDASSNSERRPVPVAGLPARELAADILNEVLWRHRALDDVLADTLASARALALPPRDRGLARLIAATVLRRKLVIENLLQQFMERPLDERHSGVHRIMLIGAAQMLYLDTPPHAAINLAVAQCRRHPAMQRFDKLVNAVLRRVDLQGRGELELIDPERRAVPDFLWERWTRAYGEAMARRIIAASLAEPPLDITLTRAASAGEWAEQLQGTLLSTGSIRLAAGGRIEDRPGFEEGQWWVQDAAAALPALLLGVDLNGLTAVDLCAAPGGKTAQLAASGATTTALDISPERLQRVAENLSRLHLDAEIIAADAVSWRPQRQFDRVLLDAPCTATGTIRRHPDIVHLKRPGDIERLLPLQKQLLEAASGLVAPGGKLVYATCSLEPLECERQVDRFLDRSTAFRREPVTPGEAGIPAEWITPAGDLRTFPFNSPANDAEQRGMDGFYAARLVRI